MAFDSSLSFLQIRQYKKEVKLLQHPVSSGQHFGRKHRSSCCYKANKFG